MKNYEENKAKFTDFLNANCGMNIAEKMDDYVQIFMEFQQQGLATVMLKKQGVAIPDGFHEECNAIVLEARKALYSKIRPMLEQAFANSPYFDAYKWYTRS